MADLETWQDRERREAALGESLLRSSRSNLVNALSEFGIQKNPSVRNYTLDLLGPTHRGIEPKNYGTLTNMPNTLVLLGHGTPTYGFDKTTWKGLLEDETFKGKLPDLIKAKRDAENAVWINAKLRGIEQPERNFGVALDDIAQSLGGETNQIKRIVLGACYRAGYSPEEIRARFPNVDEIIAGDASKPASGTYLNDILNEKPSEYPVDNNFSEFYNYQNGKTNVLKSAGDWLKTDPLPEPTPLLPQRID